MGIMSDKWIIRQGEQMITPFVAHAVRTKTNNGVTEKIISYGVSSYGYDLRVADDFKIFTNTKNAIVDPKNFTEDNFVVHKGEGKCVIPPNSFILARTVEKITMRRNVLGIVIGKSSYARCGLVLNTTPIEPEWRGYITLEISNTTPNPAIVYANEGIAQLMFFEGNEPCKVTYADRDGKYQDQGPEIIIPRL